MKHSAIAIQIAAIFLLTICVTAGEAQSNYNIIDSSRAQMLVPFSQVSKDDFVIDVSEGNIEYMNGAVSIPYTNFIKDNKLRSKEEISRILRDAGVPCDRIIYIYGKCAPCGGGSAPAEYVYLILKSFGYQAKLLDGSLEQWEASGGQTTDTPSFKPKTNCTPAVKSEGAEKVNQTRIAIGNGSKTEGGFEGTVTAQIENPNGTLSEEGPYTFEANSTSSDDTNLTWDDMNITRNFNLQVNKDPGLDQDYENTCDRDMGVAISLLVGVIGKIDYYDGILQKSLSEMQAVGGLGRRLLSPEKPEEKPPGQRRIDEPEEPETRIAQATAWLPSSGVFEEEPPGPRRIATPEENNRVLDLIDRIQYAQHNLLNLHREKIEHVKFIRDLKYFGNCTRSLPPWVYVLIDDWELDQSILLPWPSNLPQPT